MNDRPYMHDGSLYCVADEELVREQAECLEILYDFNHTRPREGERREALLRAFLGEVGEGCYVEPPLHANWGRHTHMGSHVYCNFNLTLVDDGDIYIGDYVMIGPNVTIATAGHPVLPALRELVYQHNQPVHVGRNVWIGAGAILLPGVSVGENSVIGAGSVVTKDIPANVIAVGNPCRVLREIGEKDREYYYRDRRIPEELLREMEQL